MIAFRLVFTVLYYDVYDEEWVEALCSVLRLVRPMPKLPKAPKFSQVPHDMFALILAFMSSFDTARATPFRPSCQSTFS